MQQSKSGYKMDFLEKLALAVLSLSIIRLLIMPQLADFYTNVINSIRF